MDQTFLGYVKAELSKLRPSEFEAISLATGVPVGTIRKLHYGEVENPRVETVQRLHDHFRVTGAEPSTEVAA